MGLVSLNAKAAERIALIGDSTVATYSDSKGKHGWGQYFGGNFKSGSASIANHAIGGTSTKTYYNNSEWKKVLKERGDYLLIQFGHNDSHSDAAKHTDPKTSYRDYLRKFIKEAKREGFTPVLVTSPHRRRFSGKEPSSELKPYVDAMKAVASEQGVMLVDLYQMSGDELKRLGEGGSQKLYIKGDNTHFSTEGAKLFGSFVAGRLKKLDPALAPIITAAEK